MTNEGTTQVKESKITLLSNQLNMFKMKSYKNITSWFNRYTTIVNQLNQLGRIISKDELVNRLLRSLPKTWRSMVVAIRETKDLNKISLDEICDSLFTYKQEVIQIDKKEKKKVVEKNKGLALKMSSKEKEIYDTSCEDKDVKTIMLARRYKKLSFQ